MGFLEVLGCELQAAICLVWPFNFNIFLNLLFPASSSLRYIQGSTSNCTSILVILYNLAIGVANFLSGCCKKVELIDNVV